MDVREQLQETLGEAYTLERELGGGGMSRVFLADERRLNRKVVIKLLSPELAAGVNAERFEREIQLVASLQQANIVPILSAGDTNGLPFYSMPYVEGESLRAVLAREGRLTSGVAAGILRDVLKALEYAHGHGVVHRDIKPDNVLLSGGTAVVTDFGIARALSASRSDEGGGTLTQIGTSVGTPAYMSPEQVAGDPVIDRRSDIYSLGCMAYELLTGETPFHGRPSARMLAAHLNERPQPLSARAPDVPEELQRVVMRCLEKDPAARPQSGNEVLQVLDALSDSSKDRTTGSSLARTLSTYAAALAAVAVVARASVIALGVPDWVFPAALTLMLLGLPVVLLAWRANRAGSSRLTWRRVRTAAVGVLISFVGIVIVFSVLRAMGIGPVGSLLAAGKLEDRGRLIVTAFSAPDSSLGTLVTEAVRTNLGQSHVVSIIPPVAIAAALQRMQRPPTTALTLDLAREVAQREGVMAIVDGAVRALAGGYVLSLRLVSTDSVKELAAFQETADSPREILKAIDKLTRKLRGKIGESLRDVRSSPPLEQVTTPSLEALRIYAEAARFLDMGGSPIEGAERLREAIRLDTTFAMAYRKLGVALNNSGMPRPRIDSALAGAYRFRDRLTERERLLAEGTYFHLGPGRNRLRAMRAYEALLAIDPNESGAANNLANIHSGRRDFARAESLYKAMVQRGRATSQNYTNLVSVLFNGGKVDEAQHVADEARERFPTSVFARTAPVNFLYQRGKLDSMELRFKEMAQQTETIARLSGLAGLANLAILRGRVDEGLRLNDQAQRLQLSLGQPPDPFADSVRLAWLDLLVYDDTARAIRRVEGVVARRDLRAMPFAERPYSELANFFAAARNPQRARTYLAQHDAEIPDSITRRDRASIRHEVLANIAVAEGRFQEALREEWMSDSTYDGPNGNCAICILDDIGWIWNSAGQADSAIYYFERFQTLPYLNRQGVDVVARPRLLKRLAELYEAKGDVPNAALRYREFIKLWEHADPRLQGKVADARFHLARLADIERK